VAVRPYGVVAHEAAHVVVGVALGLRLHSAVVKRWYEGYTTRLGWTWFPRARGIADALISAAGVAWSNATRDGLGIQDECDLRELVNGTADWRTCVTAAAAILETRATAHARVVRALLEHDLTHADIERLARGVSPTRLRDEDET
jgi:hypothetical protein